MPFLHIFIKELCHFVKGYDVLSVIEVSMNSSGDYHQLLVFRAGISLYHIVISIAAEIAGVGFFSVNYKYCGAYLIAVAQN